MKSLCRLHYLVKNMVHLLFEQSGTFRDEFKKLGYEAECYDIQNEYGKTDNICDLFSAINLAYEDKPSILDRIRGGGRMYLHFSLALSLKHKRHCGLEGRTLVSAIGAMCRI